MSLPNLIAQAAESAVTLEPAGMVVMAVSILLVVGLTLFCVLRILREPTPAEHHHAPLDIDTHDVEA